MYIKLEKNERIDDLEYKGLKIVQNTEGFCFGMDSVLLSDFAKKIKANSTVVDLGTGTGIIGILLSAKTKAKKIIGIEIQKNVYEMAKKSVKINNLEEKFKIINDDIKNINMYIKNNSIDVVVTNPPYKKKDCGLTNYNETKLISRHEIKCTLEDIIKQSTKILKSQGEFYLVHRPERVPDIIELLRKYKLEPKTMKVVYSKISKPAKLILIKAIKNGRPFLEIEKPLIIYNEDGTYTEELLRTYNKI